MRIARTALALLAIFWIVLLLAAPTAAFGVPISALVYGVGSFICHQRAERSFHLAGAQLPVCARCMGLYIGGAAALATAWTLARLPALRIILIAAAIPTAITWTSEILGLWSGSNTMRFYSALPLGAAVGLTVNYVQCAPRRPIEPNSPRTLI